MANAKHTVEAIITEAINPQIEKLFKSGQSVYGLVSNSGSAVVSGTATGTRCL